MLRTLVIGSRNTHKVAEIRQILAGLPFHVVSVSEYPDVPDVVEDGATFRDNALKKARETAAAVGQLTLADDSGLEVDALDGRPGVYSARYAGEPSTDSKNNAKLLTELTGVAAEQRTARFRCVMALVDPDGDETTVEGTCHGCIGHELKGEHGFGYDPLFVVDGYDSTMAQLGPTVKNRISHRARALQELKNVLNKMAQSS